MKWVTFGAIFGLFFGAVIILGIVIEYSESVIKTTYVSSDGHVLADNVELTDRNFANDCEIGYIKDYDPTLGSFCRSEKIKSFVGCSDEICYVNGVTKQEC